MRLLSETFRSIKPPNLKASSSSSKPPPPSSPHPSSSSLRISKSRSWCVYLILSTNTPIKTYVGVTTNFYRRLKQHNGELKGGAKASRAGRPWVCACLIHGFNGQSQACEFESKWKSFTRKLPQKRNGDDEMKQRGDNSQRLLQHRHTALERVKDLKKQLSLSSRIRYKQITAISLQWLWLHDHTALTANQVLFGKTIIGKILRTSEY